MTLYAESSAVLRWLFEEAGGDEVHRLLRDATKVVCSRLTMVETRRVIRRAVAQKLLDEVISTPVPEVFAQAGARWAILELSREVAERAEGSFPVEPVRTLEALHLASALLLRQALPDLRILSTDDRVRSNGSGLGFEVFPARGGAVAPALRRPARANRRPALGRRRGVVREQQRPCWAARSGV